jgi:hypothetical protein
VLAGARGRVRVRVKVRVRGGVRVRVGQYRTSWKRGLGRRRNARSTGLICRISHIGACTYWRGASQVCPKESLVG